MSFWLDSCSSFILVVSWPEFLTIICMKGKIYYYFYYFYVLFTIKQDVKTITLSSAPQTNTIMLLSPILFCLFYYYCVSFLFFCLRIITECHIRDLKVRIFFWLSVRSLMSRSYVKVFITKTFLLKGRVFFVCTWIFYDEWSFHDTFYELFWA